jgi:superfamily II DNA or RNA helicase
MELRPYQNEAVEAIEQEWEGGATSVLAAMPTGTGKTQVFSEVVRRRLHLGRAIVIAHREELIFQAAHRLKEITGVRPGIEMASMKATEGLWEGEQIVVSTVQTQTAGRNGGRMTKFDPNQYATLVIDEAHHATSKTYRQVIEYYTQNPDLKVLGVTATPDRHDEEALGQIFDEVPSGAVYELPDAIDDGWLVPILQRAVRVEGLDFSKIRTTAGDLNGADLASVMEAEKMLHEIAGPTLEIAQGRKTLVFAASVAHAERLCEIFNRPGYGGAGTADWVCGTTPKLDRREMMRRYAAGDFQILVNVGVATEGFDEPGIQVVIMARPTKSRALYAQMAGRGTRAIPGIFTGLETPEQRRRAIKWSGKPACEIVDFVGNAGRHKLVTTAELLGGKYSEEAIAAAEEKAKDADGEPIDIKEALEEAEKEIRRAEQEKRRQEEEEGRRRAEARRSGVAGRARYSTKFIDPFDILDITPVRERGWNVGKEISPKMRSLLEKQGIDVESLDYAKAKQLVGRLITRFKRGLCTLKQANLLRKFDWFEGHETLEGASEKITRIKAAGWRKPRDAEVQDEIPF